MVKEAPSTPYPRRSARRDCSQREQFHLPGFPATRRLKPFPAGRKVETKVMRMFQLQVVRAAGLGIVVFTLGGCATKSLWEQGSVAAFNEPAPEARVRLYQARGRSDVLVVYEEFSERKAAVRTRAYYLQENASRLEHRRAPHFVGAKEARSLEPIQMQVTTNKASVLTGAELSALVNANGRAFTLWLNGEKIGEHELPVYDDGSGSVKRVLWTPAAVVADATIVGGALFLWAWSSGALNCP